MPPHSYSAISSYDEIALPDSDEMVLVTDTLLGFGWYYADLVHSDPKQEKAIALEFPYNFRYNQGVKLVSYLALIISSLLKLIREINDIHELELPPEAWTSQVVAGDGPFEFGNGKAYIGPSGFKPPTGTTMEEIPEFKELNSVTARRLQDPSSAVDIHFINSSGNVAETHEGFYTIDTKHNSVVINIENKVLLSGKPEKEATPVGDLPFEKAFFLKAIGPINGKTEQYQEFLAKARNANRIEILMSWRGAQVHGTITFPPLPSSSNGQH